jgi:hypothetical protein
MQYSFSYAAFFYAGGIRVCCRHRSIPGRGLEALKDKPYYAGAPSSPTAAVGCFFFAKKKPFVGIFKKAVVWAPAQLPVGKKKKLNGRELLKK